MSKRIVCLKWENILKCCQHAILLWFCRLWLQFAINEQQTSFLLSLFCYEYSDTATIPKEQSFIREECTLISKPAVKPKPNITPKPEQKPTNTTEYRPSETFGSLKPGDKVCVQLMELELKDAQRGHGGWSLSMADVTTLYHYFIYYNKWAASSKNVNMRKPQI